MFDRIAEGKLSWLDKLAIKEGWKRMPKWLSRWVPLISGLYLAGLAVSKGLCSAGLVKACSFVAPMESVGGLLNLVGNVPPELLPGIAGLGLGAGAIYKAGKNLKPAPKPEDPAK